MSFLVPYGRNATEPFDLMRRFFDGDWNNWADNSLGGLGNIRTDIRETEKEYVLEAEMPGIKKDQINIAYENGVLTLSVKQENQTNVDQDRYLRRERYYGEMRRSFSMDNIKEEGISAQYKDGILSVTLPKDSNREGRQRMIEIQ